MKNFLLVVNVLALTLPFLAAEVQNQEKPACHENNERLFNQKTVSYDPVYYMLSSYPHYEPYFYRHRLAILINRPYIPYTYYAKPVVLKPHAQVSQWQALPSIHAPTMARVPHRPASFIAIPPRKIQHKAPIPTTPTITTTATAEPTPIPATDPAATSVVTPETSSVSAVTNTLEAAAVTVTPEASSVSAITNTLEAAAVTVTPEASSVSAVTNTLEAAAVTVTANVA
ncbi:kappa-casein [Otolemur garnettii]|uniref:kappa-casein n=1 Tax=Otolemur garnettii TaxID=30611 RepID=UPI0002742466|nr:kappa-casein [Otolemur garnettii]